MGIPPRPRLVPTNAASVKDKFESFAWPLRGVFGQPSFFSLVRNGRGVLALAWRPMDLANSCRPAVPPVAALAVLALLSGCKTSAGVAPKPFSSVAGTATSSSTSSVASAASPTTSPSSARVTPHPPWIAELKTEQDFLNYSKEVNGERYAKFIVELKTNQIYYVDAELYPMHKDFIFAELLKTARTKAAEQQLDRNYGKDKPAYIMCYLVHHLEPDKWSFSYWDGDRATATHTKLAYERMKATFYGWEKVRFRPHSNDQETMASELPQIGRITNDELYKLSDYQAFNTGRAVGTLRVIAKGATYPDLDIAPDEIVILPEPLTDITPVAGLLSETFSTPLAHVNLRAAAWGVPNVALKKASTKFADLVGKQVVFEASKAGVTMHLATPGEIAAAKEARARGVSSAVQVPKADLSSKALRTLAQLRASDAHAFGSKAANLGEIVAAKEPGLVVPAGFVVPIAHYAAHLSRHGIDREIETMLADATFQSDRTKRRTMLEALRKRIQDAPIDAVLERDIGAALGRLTLEARLPISPAKRLAVGDAGVDGGGNRSQDAGAPRDPLLAKGETELGVFVRSSTNAEDLEGFSGAGLYDTVPNVRGAGAVANAVKRVWASVWNFAAYEERERYKVSQSQVFGAVLIQVGINATAAGVLVTAHASDPTNIATFTINAKSGLGIRVVDGKKVPEIVMYNTFNKAVRVLARSDEDTMLVFDQSGGVKEVATASEGRVILTNERLTQIVDAGIRLRTVFPKTKTLDVEWLLRGDELFVVQARPYLGSKASNALPPRKEAGPELPDALR
jgi:Pyruvate phosphate dikinase, AMP/ATP-binding domain